MLAPPHILLVRFVPAWAALGVHSDIATSAAMRLGSVPRALMWHGGNQASGTASASKHSMAGNVPYAGNAQGLASSDWAGKGNQARRGKCRNLVSGFPAHTR
jgi:hypothetical protein